jgi:TonB family protein
MLLKSVKEKISFAFGLALLIHLLLLISFSLSFSFDLPLQAFEKKSDHYLPAYLLEKGKSREDGVNGSIASFKKNKASPTQNNKDGILIKKHELAANPEEEKVATINSRSSAAYIEAESLKTGKPENQPLLKELSRATAAKLSYPPEAAAFKLKGTVTVSFLLYPDGRVTDVAIIQSSGFFILDNAALNTIKSISPVRDANLYISKPEVLTVGIIYG